MRKYDVKRKVRISTIVKLCQHMVDIPSSMFDKIDLTKSENNMSISLVFNPHERLKNAED